jgi:hypothetical protein
MSSPLAGGGGDKDPRNAPGAPNGGPAIDPKTGKPLSAPGTPGGGPSSDPGNPDPALDPKSDDDAPLEFTADKLPPTADEFFERVKNSKTPILFRNLSLDVMTTLKAKYGCDLAFGLQQMGTIGSYAAWQVVVAGCGNAFQAHHIVEQKVLEHFGYPADICPAVILTAAEHIEVSKILTIRLPPGDIDDLTRKQILDGYTKTYRNHLEWLAEVERYLPRPTLRARFSIGCDRSSPKIKCPARLSRCSSPHPRLRRDQSGRAQSPRARELWWVDRRHRQLYGRAAIRTERSSSPAHAPRCPWPRPGPNLSCRKRRR